ncbi:MULTISPECIES: SWIM zinc finger family protein [Anaerolinea]|nr:MULTISPECIES: SWIM zinc finger family protein [Anaerolinea]GAP07452.1 SWIM zinc finger [Anaerolinea thermolimosa]
MNVRGFIGSEAAKRRERMLDAVKKDCFQIQSRQFYRGEGKTITLWEVWSSHTHRRYPRLYVVSRVEAQGRIAFGCTCPDFESNGQWFPCKHILFVQQGG